MPPYHAHQWTAIHPTVIQHIVHANLLSDSQDCLVFAKGAWLQLLRIVPDGPLEPLFEQPLAGTISDIARVLCNWTYNLPPQSTPHPSKLPYTCAPITHAPIVSNDVLVATSDQGSLVFLAVVVPPHGDLVDNGRFEIVAEVPLVTPGNEYTKVGRKMAVDPMSRAVAVAAYQDNLDVFIMNPSVSRTSFMPVHSMLSIQEQGIIYQMEFLHTNEQHKMYLMVTFYNDVELVCRLIVYIIDTSDPDNMTIERNGRLPLERVGPLPLLLIPIPHVPEAFILITELYASYLTVDDVYSGNVLHPMSNIPTGDNGEAVIFTAYTALKSVIYLGTSDGDFYGLDVNSLEWQYFGQRNSVGMAMQYLGSVHQDGRRKDILVYAGEGADHEVIELDVSSPPSISVLQAVENRAPLIDAHVSRDLRSSLDVLYACTGQHRHGAVREIRSGIGVEILSISPSDPQWDGVTGIWHLPYTTYNDHFYLVISFAMETRVLSNENDEIQDVSESCGFVCDNPTIFAGWCNDTSLVLVQALDSSIVLSCLNPLLQTTVPLETILPSSKIAHVAMDHTMLILCTCSADHQWILTKLLVNPASLDLVNSTTLASDASFVSKISVSPEQMYLIVGTHKPSICIYSLDDLTCVWDEPLDHVSTAGINIPESCAFIHSASCSFLTVGLRDGTLVSYPLEWMIDGSIELGKPCVRPLGSLPLKLISQSNQSCLAVSEHIWLVTQQNKRIVIKPVSVFEPGRVAAITCLPSEGVHQCYAAVIDQKLCMISLDPSQDINTRSIHIGETPRRVLHDKPTNSLIVAYSGRSSVGRQDGLHVVNQGKIVAGIKMAEHEIICSMVGWSIQHQGKTYRYICVGIAIQTATRHSQQHLRRPAAVESGRLLLYRLKVRKHDMQHSLSQVWHEDSLPAGVFAICPHAHGLLFSTGRTLHLHQLDISTGRLEMVAQESARSPITLIQVAQDRICVGTQLDSLSFYRYDAASRKLLFLKSDPMMRTVSGATMPHASLVIGTERYGGIVGLMEDTAKPQSRLLPLAFQFHMPDVALGVQAGTMSLMDRLEKESILPWDDTAASRKTILACTLTGGVVAVRRITQETFQLLQTIELRIRELNCAQLLSTIYRPNESVRTLDGDMLRLFLRMPLPEQEVLVNNIDMDHFPNLKSLCATHTSAVDKVIALLMNLQYL